MARLAEQSFERRGDYEALLFEGCWHSSGELHERSLRLAAGLAELGIAPGDRVVVTMARFLVCSDGADGLVSLAELERAEPAEIVPRADEELAALLYTGGTTGRAKGVMLTHATAFHRRVRSRGGARSRH